MAPTLQPIEYVQPRRNDMSMPHHTLAGAGGPIRDSFDVQPALTVARTVEAIRRHRIAETH